MNVPIPSADPIIFAVTKFISEQRCLASIVSSHRCIDVTFLHTSWTVRSCTTPPIELTCGTLPLETVCYADPPERISDHELIRWAGQSQTELCLSSTSEKFNLTVFLTTGRP